MRKRRVWNAMIDRRPAVIVRCRSAADVMAAVNYVRDNVLPMAKRASHGHLFTVQRSGARCGEYAVGAWRLEAIQPYISGGVYVNELGEDQGNDRVRQAYGDNYKRLSQIKGKYDAKNLFRLNANILPA